ncbi:hypothetical protein M0D45_14120 [Xanthomonas prunicola]|uniref:hypothetical protein n=1 Tax=Xanthomonas prunicola TaxID=2053930 RepID=UPI0021B481EC|nr:hypothetical protein [Xanthomonas prunicola]UXA51844.1 hypothetical protein M0D45_14120 [Xanthomonas prunicola]
MVTSDMGCGGALGDVDGVCARVGAAVTSNSEASKTVIKGARMQRPCRGPGSTQIRPAAGCKRCRRALTAMPALRAL